MKSAKGFAKFAMASFLTFKTASAVHKALEDGVLTDAECIDIATATLNLIGQGNPIKQAITLFLLDRKLRRMMVWVVMETHWMIASVVIEAHRMIVQVAMEAQVMIVWMVTEACGMATMYWKVMMLKI